MGRHRTCSLPKKRKMTTGEILDFLDMNFKQKVDVTAVLAEAIAISRMFPLETLIKNF